MGAIETTMTLRPTDTAMRRVLGPTDVTPRAANVGLVTNEVRRESIPCLPILSHAL